MSSISVLKYQSFIFKMLGMLTTPESSCFLKLWGVIVFIWCGIILVCCQSISVVYADNTNQLIEELLFLFTTSTIAMKLAFFQLRRQHVSNMLEILNTVDERIKSFDEISIVKNVYRRCRRTTTTFYCMYNSSFLSLAIQLMFLEKHERTWKSTILVPSEFAQQPSVYYSVLFLQIVGNFLNVICAVSLDTYCFAILGSLSGHIEVLSLKVSKITNSKKDTKKKSKLEHLMNILEHYNLLIDYANELNNSLSSIFFVQVSISAPIICTCAYQSAQAQNLTTTQLLFLFFYAAGMLLQIFAPNYLAQEVLEKCYLLPESAFSSEWFKLNEIEKKAMLLFITRSIHPLKVHAGEFFEMNIDTFLRITKTAFSLLAVLNNTES